MKHVVTYEFGDTVTASIMTSRQLAETKAHIMEALEVEDDKAQALLAWVQASIKGGDAPKQAASPPSFGSL